jgi:hypothetical protein
MRRILTTVAAAALLTALVPTAYAADKFKLTSVPDGFNPLTASTADLARYGFPPRPDTVDGLNDWQNVMSRARHPVTSILGDAPYGYQIKHTPKNSKGIDNPNVNSSNWSGFAVPARPGQHFSGTITMNFTVPNISAVDATQDWISIWPGFDGLTDGNVLQAGVDCFVSTGQAPVCFTFAEFFPDNAIGLFNVSPGDFLQVSVTRPRNTQLGEGQISISDMTTGQFANGFINCTSCSSDPFTGSSDDWIVEAPTVNGVEATLANYVQANLIGEANAGTQPSNPAADDISMIQNGIVVSTCVITQFNAQRCTAYPAQ